MQVLQDLLCNPGAIPASPGLGKVKRITSKPRPWACEAELPRVSWKKETKGQGRKGRKGHLSALKAQPQDSRSSRFHAVESFVPPLVPSLVSPSVPPSADLVFSKAQKPGPSYEAWLKRCTRISLLQVAGRVSKQQQPVALLHRAQ